MQSDFFAPLIATLFFVSATLAGIYIYCCFFRKSREENDQNKSTDKAHREYEEERNVGITRNFCNHMYPLSMALPPRDLYGHVNIGFVSSPPHSPPVLEEKTAKVLVCPFEGEDMKVVAPDRPLFCRSTSHDTKRVSLHCQLQVIQEVTEEEILEEEEFKAKVGE